ncbi:hypothetical protein AAHC03_020912 [Spirometra sp. Aus1]
MPMLEVISLSSNKIESLEAFAHCRTLRELYLRNNNISNLDEIQHLRALPHLHTLFLLGNPCCYAPDNSTEPANYYRPTVISQLPSLERLDMRSVSEEEKRAAGVGAVEHRAAGDSMCNKENILHERIFPGNQVHTGNDFEEETMTRSALPVLPTISTLTSYSDKSNPIIEPPVPSEATIRPIPPLLFSQETLDSARTHIPTFSFCHKTGPHGNSPAFAKAKF